MAWIHANADEYGFDPGRVIVLGGSAGGYLAGMVGTVDDRELFAGDCPHKLPEDPVAGAVVFYAFFDRTLDDCSTADILSLEAFWGAAHDELSTEQLTEMSPTAWVDGSEPPFLLLHGTLDTSVPSVMSERFRSALGAAGVQAELVLIEGAVHAFETYPTIAEENVISLGAIERFIEQLG